MGGRASSIASAILTITVLIIIVLIITGVVRIAVVEGISMEPTLHTGDMVFLEKKAPGDIRPGDIVVYKGRGRYIIHRVIRVFKYNYHGSLETCYVVKGDNNPVPDPGFPQCGGRGIPYEAIMGVVVSAKPGVPIKVPYLGGISVALRG